MFSYSSEEFRKDWRFSIEKDFIDSSGNPFVYADDGLKTWGEEDLCIPCLPSKNLLCNRSIAISDDGQTVAVSDEQEIGVFNIADAKKMRTLQGHLSKIEGICFVPNRPDLLVSYSDSGLRGRQDIKSQTIIWDLEHHTPNSFASPEVIQRLSRNAANIIVADMKQLKGDANIEASEQIALAETLKDSIKQFVLPKGAAQNINLHGRCFSRRAAFTQHSSESLMLYLPGDRNLHTRNPDNWELGVYSITRQKEVWRLRGHSDLFTWAGFSPDETLIGTVSFDRAVRIWDVASGTQKYLWNTHCQNKRGSFSPDGKYLTALVSDGSVRIYDLEHGTEHLNVKVSGRSCQTMSWHPAGRLLAIGGDDWGRIVIFDMDKQEVVHERKLNGLAMDESKRRMAGAFVRIARTAYVDGGRKLITLASGDGSAEVYDFETARKWRFARAGTMGSLDEEVNSKGGCSIAIHENKKERKIMVAVVDDDAVRFWYVSMNS